MINPLKQLYELQDYKDDAIAFIAQETLILHEEFSFGRITKTEFVELVDDLRQTKTISDHADVIQTNIVLDEVLHDLISALGSI